MKKIFFSFTFLFTLFGFILQPQAEEWVVRTANPEQLADLHVKALHGTPYYLVESSLAEAELNAIDGVISVEKNEQVILTDNQRWQQFKTLTVQTAKFPPFPYGKQQVKVAVLDTGVNLVDPLLSPYLEPGISLVANETVQDLNGHGTAMTHLIIEDAPKNLRVLPIKVMNQAGESSIFTVIEGLHAAKDAGVSIINLSFGAERSSEALHNTIKELTAHGITIVAAVGNSSGVGAFYPARYEEVIGVGSHDELEQIASFSQTGTGVDIYVIGTNMKTRDLNGEVMYKRGTSLSTAYMAKQLAYYETLTLQTKPVWRPWLLELLDDRQMYSLDTVHGAILSQLNEKYEEWPAVVKENEEAITITLSQEVDHRSVQLGSLFAIADEQLFPVEGTVEGDKLVITPEKSWETGVQIYLTTCLQSMQQSDLHQAVKFKVVGRGDGYAVPKH